jgi:hypothetical protein
MTTVALDCCSILSLYAGWNGLEELRRFDYAFVASSISLNEASYSRDFSIDNSICRVELGKEAILSAGVIREVELGSAREEDCFIQLARRIDDGEAETIAICASRGYVFVTDDRLARTVAATVIASELIRDTPSLLSEWQTLFEVPASRLGEVLRRVSVLAKYLPPPNHPLRTWWLDAVEKRQRQDHR